MINLFKYLFRDKHDYSEPTMIKCYSGPKYGGYKFYINR